MESHLKESQKNLEIEKKSFLEEKKHHGQDLQKNPRYFLQKVEKVMEQSPRYQQKDQQSRLR